MAISYNLYMDDRFLDEMDFYSASY